MWNSNVDPSGFDYNNNYYGYVQDTYMDQVDSTSLNDFNSTYAPSNANSEYNYSQHGASDSRRGHYAQAPKVSRRESARSDAMSRGYADSGFHSAVSPTVEVDPYLSYAHGRNHDFDQEYTNIGQSAPDSPGFGSEGENSGYFSEGSGPARNDPLYNASPAADGFYYCPFAERDGCGHEPKMLKCEYDKYIDSHLKPFRCRHRGCAELQFSSTACLLRHEREAHRMHGHEESLCVYPPCSRSIAGNGFRRSYNCKDHMTRCHGWVDENPQESKKKRSGGSSSSGPKATKTKSSNKVLSKKQQIAQLKDEWTRRKARLEELARALPSDGPLFAIAVTQISSEMETLKSIQTEWSKLTGRSHVD